MSNSKRWSEEKAWSWYDSLPYLVGANFVPSNAINQLEMWQAETFDPVTIDRELGWARKLGMNTMRVYLHDLLWENDSAAFTKRINQFLDITAKNHIRPMLVIFDDCWNDVFSLGSQPAPKPFAHNSGWIQSPGKKIVNDPSQWPRLEKYVTQLLTSFHDDSRILAWDLYNEPGNGNVGDATAGGDKQGRGSLPFLKAVFEWARSVEGLTQPITVAPWAFGPEFKELIEVSVTNSDFISFHNYEHPLGLSSRIREYAKFGRPMVCSEYMCRGLGSTFVYCLPIMKRHRVGAINWGLVAGKTQTIYPWGWNESKGVPDVWFHDVFNQDGTMLYPHEERAFREISS